MSIENFYSRARPKVEEVRLVRNIEVSTTLDQNYVGRPLLISILRALVRITLLVASIILFYLGI